MSSLAADAYRLCKADANVTEQCFQAGHLEFAGQSQWIAYPNGTRSEMPLRMTTIGTTPKGSQWARDPVPQCYECDAYTTCGAPLPPEPNPVPPTPSSVKPPPTKDGCAKALDGFCGKEIGTKQCGACASSHRPELDKAGCTGPEVIKLCEGVKPEDNCTKQLKDLCGPLIGTKRCGSCAASHRPELDASGCTGPEVIKLCQGGGRKPAGKNKWDAQVNCDANCAGAGTSHAGPCPGATAFPEPLPGISGFGKVVWPWSIVGE